MQTKVWAKAARAWTLIGVLVVLLGGWTADLATASSKPLPDFVTRVRVTGRASVVMESDKAVINAEILGRGPTSIEAQTEANRVYEAVDEALEGLGVKHDAGHYALHPYWEHRGEQGSVRAGYEARRQLSVYVDDVTRVGEVVDSLLHAGISAIYGIEYTLSEHEKVEEQVLTDALSDARRKAEVVARQLGLDVLAVEEVSVGQSNAYPMTRAAMLESARPSMAPSPVSIDATVNVTYLLGTVE